MCLVHCCGVCMHALNREYGHSAKVCNMARKLMSHPKRHIDESEQYGPPRGHYENGNKATRRGPPKN